MKQTINIFSVMLLALIINVQQIEANPNDHVMVVEVPANTVRVEVSNAGKSSLELYGEAKFGYAKLADFEGKEKFTFEVPCGRFILFNPKSGMSYSVPAIDVVFWGQVEEDPFRITISDNKLDDGWAWIPAGPSIIGDTLGIGAEDERPVRVLEIPGFWMAVHEVTNKQYAKFLSAQDYFDPAWIDLNSRKCLIRENVAQDGFEPDTVANEKAAKMPVVMISHEGASKYCEWLTKTTGVVHRLPKEIEWEKAARGPRQYVYAYGDTYDSSAANQESGQLMPVGSYTVNGYGLHDMTGNVFEWMGNQYDPHKGTPIMNQALRGGSFVLDGMYLRNSFRMRQSPDVMTDDIGFRVLREDHPSNNKETK